MVHQRPAAVARALVHHHPESRRVNAGRADLDDLLTNRTSTVLSRRTAMDALYVGLAVGFFALCWAFVILCERV
jgi:hypothetical protein